MLPFHRFCVSFPIIVTLVTTTPTPNLGMLNLMWRDKNSAIDGCKDSFFVDFCLVLVFQGENEDRQIGFAEIQIIQPRCPPRALDCSLQNPTLQGFSGSLVHLREFHRHALCLVSMWNTRGPLKVRLYQYTIPSNRYKPVHVPLDVFCPCLLYLWCVLVACDFSWLMRTCTDHQVGSLVVHT